MIKLDKYVKKVKKLLVVSKVDFCGILNVKKDFMLLDVVFVFKKVLLLQKRNLKLQLSPLQKLNSLKV